MDNGAECYRRFLCGDSDALAELIALYNDSLTLFIHSFVGNFAVADELSEDVFVKLFIKKPRFSGQSSFKTWLYAVGRNTARDYLRKNAKSPAPLSDDSAGDDSVETAILKEERKITLYRCLQSLNPRYRQALWLVYFAGLSVQDTAKVMKKSVHGTESLLSRARGALKTKLEAEGITDENL